MNTEIKLEGIGAKSEVTIFVPEKANVTVIRVDNSTGLDKYLFKVPSSPKTHTPSLTELYLKSASAHFETWGLKASKTGDAFVMMTIRRCLKKEIKVEDFKSGKELSDKLGKPECDWIRAKSTLSSLSSKLKLGIECTSESSPDKFCDVISELIREIKCPKP